MEENLALKLLRILRRNWKGEPLKDEQVRKLTGLDQMDIDIAAEQLEAEGMISVERTYTLVEE
jgi:predicted transcriptional regulator